MADEKKDDKKTISESGQMLRDYLNNKDNVVHDDSFSDNKETKTKKEESQKEKTVETEKKQLDIVNPLESKPVDTLSEWAGNIKIHGGLAVLFVLLIVLIFVLVPVNGHTRMELLYYTLLGKTKLNASGVQSSGSGGEQVSQNNIVHIPVLPKDFDFGFLFDE